MGNVGGNGCAGMQPARDGFEVSPSYDGRASPDFDSENARAGPAPLQTLYGVQRMRNACDTLNVLPVGAGQKLSDESR